MMSSGQNELSKVWENDLEFLKIVSDLSGLSIALWPTGKPLTNGCWTSCSDHIHPCFTKDELRFSLEKYCHDDRPSIFIENEQIVYGIMPIGSFSLAIGPAALWTASEQYIKAYSTNHKIKDPIPIPRKEAGLLVRWMRLLYIHFTGSSAAVEDIAVTNDVLDGFKSIGALEEYQLDQSENDRKHQAGMEYENNLIRLVQKGDTAAVKKLLSGPNPDYSKIGELSEAENKTNEYLVVSIITLMTRAAVAGGASVEAAYGLGDVYLRRLSRAAVRREPFLSLSYKAIFDFAELVKQSREERSELSYINACKEYIDMNLRKNLQVGDIAPAIGLSRTYLSRLFHQAEGITIQQYIQKERCRHAAQMLQYTNRSISEISLYFGFSSQSYFGSCFQHWYGMTPNAYRKLNG